MQQYHNTLHDFMFLIRKYRNNTGLKQWEIWVSLFFLKALLSRRRWIIWLTHRILVTHICITKWVIMCWHLLAPKPFPETIPTLKFESKFENLLSIICIWKYRLQNVGYFVPGLDKLRKYTRNIPTRCYVKAPACYRHHFHLTWAWAGYSESNVVQVFWHLLSPAVMFTVKLIFLADNREFVHLFVACSYVFVN